MNGESDQELLRHYALERSESAFAQLLQRHMDLVYSCALRMVRDAHLAKDVSQGVFLALAQNAAQLAAHPMLVGWLHRTTHNLAVKTIRTDVRRRGRELEAVAMSGLLSSESNNSWEEKLLRNLMTPWPNWMKLSVMLSCCATFNRNLPAKSPKSSPSRKKQLSGG